jgi:DNA polymerase-3 subunit gamma/tau
MASQALYRRYRSQTFDELVGQEHILQTLRNALAEGRVAHAYLFTGPRGVGKTTVARLLAKAVNCLAAVEQRPCGVCAMCTAIAEGRAVDVIEMDAASHTSVEDAREIIERVQFHPTSARTKVYVIDECHMLSTAAFNALLKTLEEPPAHALFILATTEVHKVPATILSRCQRFVFNRHGIAAIATHLREIAEQEGFALEPGVPEAIGRAATGSMRDALSILDQLMSYGGTTITLEQVRGLLGATESREIAALADALIAADVTAALRVVSEVAGKGADLRQFARDVVERLRALMLLKAGASSDLLDAGEDELVQLQRQASDADLAAVVSWVRLFSELDYQLRTSPYGQLPLELAVVEAIAAPSRAAAPAPPARSAPPRTAAAPPASRSAPTAERVSGQTGVSARNENPRPAVATPIPSTPAPSEAPRAATAAPVYGQAGVSALDETPRAALDQAAHAAPPSEAPRADGVYGQSDVSALNETSRPAAATPPPSLPALENEHSELKTQNPKLKAPPSDDQGEAMQAATADVLVFEQIEALWPVIVRDVRPFDKTLEALLKSGVRPIDFKDNTLVLEVPSEWLQRRLETPQLKHTVERVLSRHAGAEYSIRCVVEAQQRENLSALREQVRTVRRDPLVKAAMNIFDADIVSVEDQSKEPPL